jgi:hypothetical protein
MKARIEIELTVDGEYRHKTDEDALCEAICNSIPGGVFIIDDERLAVLVQSITIEVEE